MSGMSEPISVLKCNLAGEVTWQYEGLVLFREPNSVVLKALFNRPDTPFLDVILRERDLFVETFYTDRWYNIFEIHDRDDGRFKGWYCNIGEPAVIADGTVSYVDLALDLWVAVDGKQTVLDENEFIALNLEQKERKSALAGLTELQELIKTKQPSH